MTKQEIIEKRKDYIPYEEAEKLQNRLIKIYKKEYKPKHKPSVYLKLILDWGVGEIEERHPKDNNYTDTVFKCFSEASQHVYGCTKEHCLDQIYEAVKQKKKRIKDYKKLPTLEELVNSDIEIDTEKMYYTKEKGSHEDSCDGRSGNIIIEMRKIGINEYRKKRLYQESKRLKKPKRAGLF
jgi:hypothetical protein